MVPYNKGALELAFLKKEEKKEMEKEEGKEGKPAEPEDAAPLPDEYRKEMEAGMEAAYGKDEWEAGQIASELSEIRKMLEECRELKEEMKPAMQRRPVIMNNRIVSDDVDRMLASFQMQMKKKNGTLERKIRDVDKELVDIYHFIEFSNFNEGTIDDYVNAYVSVLMLQQKLRERRDVKDSIEKMARLKGIESSMQEAVNSFQKMETRTYVPRTAINMFEAMKNKGYVINPGKAEKAEKKAMAGKERDRKKDMGRRKKNARGRKRGNVLSLFGF